MPSDAVLNRARPKGVRPKGVLPGGARAIDVLDKMAGGTRARLERSAFFEAGVGAAIWRNSRDAAAALERPRGHIFSLYLEGGERTRRVDKLSEYGGPGKSCFLPSGHHSVWEVGAEMRFLHLYFDAEALATRAAQALDADIRDIAGRELIYVEDPVAEIAMRRIASADWDEPAERIRVTELAIEVAARKAPEWFGIGRRAAPQGGLESGLAQGGLTRGGLSPVRRRRVLDYIESALDHPLSLAELADIAGQSPWHFAKMFRQSVGVAPYAYVKTRRMALALRLLGEGRLNVTETALACGYASPTRFAAEVKAAYGAPPSVIRAALAG